MAKMALETYFGWATFLAHFLKTSKFGTKCRLMCSKNTEFELSQNEGWPGNVPKKWATGPEISKKVGHVFEAKVGQNGQKRPFLGVFRYTFIRFLGCGPLGPLFFLLLSY